MTAKKRAGKPRATRAKATTVATNAPIGAPNPLIVAPEASIVAPGAPSGARVDTRPSQSLGATERRILRSRFRPPTRMKVSEWADRFRVLSPEASFRTGPFSTDDAPYQREIMDTMGDPSVRELVLRIGSQLGKTESANNYVGYLIDQDPGPILVLQPTIGMAETWSKDRLTPMLRDTPRLHGRVADVKTRDSGNTMLHKSFRGGQLSIAGANSPAGLAARPIRTLVQDERDRFPPSAGAEGDPGSIAESRLSTFPNSKNIKISSPTVKGSPIDTDWETSDQRWFWVPCPHCQEYQKLEFGGKESAHGLKWDQRDATTAHYVCKHCACVIAEHEKMWMLRRGRWIAEHAERPIPGFTLSALYSPFYSWPRLVARWLKDKKDKLKLRTFVNTILCENYEDTGDVVTEHLLSAHCQETRPMTEDGTPLVPDGVGVLTRAVDVQGDRLETNVYGWGADEQCWRVDFELIPGDPGTPAPWLKLGELLKVPYRHAVSGALMRPAVTFIDSGGHHAQKVYDFCRPLAAEAVYAIKGSSLQEGVPLLQAPKRKKSARTITYQVGSFTGKEALMSRLTKIIEPGPSFINLGDDLDDEHQRQFMNEQLQTRIIGGRPVRAWKKLGPNEQIDLWVYNYAALHSLGEKAMGQIGERAKQLSEWVDPGTVGVSPATTAAAKPAGGWRILSRGVE